MGGKHNLIVEDGASRGRRRRTAKKSKQTKVRTVRMTEGRWDLKSTEGCQQPRLWDVWDVEYKA